MRTVNEKKSAKLRKNESFPREEESNDYVPSKRGRNGQRRAERHSRGGAGSAGNQPGIPKI